MQTAVRATVSTLRQPAHVIKFPDDENDDEGEDVDEEAPFTSSKTESFNTRVIVASRPSSGARKWQLPSREWNRIALVSSSKGISAGRKEEIARGRSYLRSVGRPSVAVGALATPGSRRTATRMFYDGGLFY